MINTKKSKHGSLSYRDRVALACLAIVLGGCGPIGALTREYYKEPETAPGQSLAAVTGSVGTTGDPKMPVHAIIGAIDEKAVGLAKSARCNYDHQYPLLPGTHAIGIGYAAGPTYGESRVGYLTLQLPAEPGEHYIARGTLVSPTQGTLWIENARSSAVVVEKTVVELKDSPEKGSPRLFGAISDSCAFP